MWRGEAINTTESRAVLHTALRVPGVSQPVPAAKTSRARCWPSASACWHSPRSVREGVVRGSGGARFARVINIGIGGSDLGPAMAVQALRPLTPGAPRVLFVSNVDGTDLANALEGANAARTLFIIASKTFSTQETLANARTARAWLAGSSAKRPYPRISPRSRPTRRRWMPSASTLTTAS